MYGTLKERRYNLEKNQLATIEKFILNEIEEIKKDRGESLKYDYWLYAMELIVRDVEIKPTLWERIKFICFDDEYMRKNTDFKWRHIYSILNEKYNKTKSKQIINNDTPIDITA